MSESELFGESSGSEMEVESERAPVRADAVLRRAAPSHTTSDAWIARVPAFLRFERRPFDKSEIAKKADANAEANADQLSQLAADSVRWQYTRAEAADRVVQTSNARIVEWSDGSRTLQVGGEHFEARAHAQPAALICEADGDLYATRLLVDQSIAFVPTSTSSATHAMLASALAKRQLSGQIRVGSVKTTEDPEKAQRDLEKAEQLREKARRKLAAQRELRDELPQRTRPRLARDIEGLEDEEEEAAAAPESEPEAVSTDNDDREDGARDEDSDVEASRLNRIKERKILDDSESE